ncbi:MAG: dihydroorotate dehydrogenase electron transfer subunit [Treponema sp.]|nr:dihydroorotate dehydrogenase electron transfer subunit [Treponema sp.]
MNHASCELLRNEYINEEVFRLDFVWNGDPSSGAAKATRRATPKAGQFFMVKPKRGGFFLGRPISLAIWQPAIEDKEYIRKKARGKSTRYQRYLTGKFLESDTLAFLIARRGGGTRELAEMRVGEDAELVGPLGNAWADFLSGAEPAGGKPVALVGGGIGLAPLIALLCESPGRNFDLYAGFRAGPRNREEQNALLGAAYLEAQNIIVVSQDGKLGHKGLIPDFLEPEKYAAVCTCGPEPMMKVVAQKCAAAGVPCFVSMERRMACGVGACLGCTVKTVNGNRRCCADGPIFDAREIIFDG